MFIFSFADDNPDAQRPSPQPKGDAKTAAPPPAPPSGEETIEDDQASVGEEINYTLALLLPWAISILFHLGIGLLAVFVVWSGAVIDEEEENIIPEAKMLNDEPSELLTYSEDLEVTATTDIPKEIQTQEVAQGDPLSEMTLDTAQDVALIGVTGSKALPAGSKIGKDKLGVGMYGLGGNARTVAYVVDASGSLIDSLPFVINELKDSFRKLSDEQRFTVIFFQQGIAIEVPAPNRGMKVASRENIKKVSDWITLENGNIVPRGSSNPVKAVQLALAYKPDLIYILSDNITGRGRYAIDQTELLDIIRKTKASRGATNTRINTIQFLYPDPLETLRKIAEQNEGRYRYVDASVVGR